MRKPLTLICTHCRNEFKCTSIEYKCPNCEGLLWIKTDKSHFKKELFNKKERIKFWDFLFALPELDSDFLVTLGEGGTPCRDSKKLGEILGISRLYFKDETLNPTNSFKDRAAAFLISHARSWNYNKVVCASNGNQGASIAAYTSLEGIDCENIIPEEIDIGKRAQMIAYNSKITIKGKTVDETLKEALKSKYKTYYQGTPEFNPLTLEAQKTIAYEIIGQIGIPDGIIIPMGSGGLLLSLWKGFKELKKTEIIDTLPRMIGVQSQASSPIVNQYDKLEGEFEKEIAPKSHALGILVRKPLYQELAIDAINKSKGIAISIPENLILTSAEELARNEGIFAEPASALTISALNSLIQQDKITSDEKIVCLITGSGLKTPHVLEAISTRAKTVGTGGILSTKLKILSQISLSEKKGIYGSKLKEIIGSVSLAAIYQHLKELEAKDLISRKKEGKNVLYFITENGKKVIEALDILITLL